MSYEAHLLMGPCDGEVVAIIEALSTIPVMSAPDKAGEQPQHHVYVREQKERRPGVYYYVYAGQHPSGKEQADGQ